jgi:hypothetical protein
MIYLDAFGGARTLGDHTVYATAYSKVYIDIEKKLTRLVHNPNPVAEQSPGPEMHSCKFSCALTL